MTKNIVCLSLCLISMFSAHAEQKNKPDWKIEVVPARNSEGKGAVLYAKKPVDVFYIILHNQSGKDLNVWRDWCPWGYNNLSMTAELEGGKKIQLTKKPKEWGKVYPDSALVRAGKSYVYEVHLAGKTWQGSKEIDDKPFKLTVFFKVKKSPESTERKVWVGEVKSEPMTVTLRQ